MDKLRNRSYKIFKCRAEGGDNGGMKGGGPQREGGLS